MTTDAAGNVYVADISNQRIQKFTAAGAYITQWGSLGGGNGQFNNPHGVATDAAGNVYVADFDNNRVQKFTGTGTYLCQWGSPGSGNGQFSGALDVATAADGDVYVADRSNNRIQKFNPTSTVGVSYPPATDHAPDLSLSAFPNPSTGQIQISFTQLTATSATLEVYDLTGRVIWKKASLSRGSKTVYWPGIDQDGTHVRPGMYFVRLRTSQERRSTSVLLLK